MPLPVDIGTGTLTGHLAHHNALHAFFNLFENEQPIQWRGQLASAPGAPSKNDFYYNTTNDTLYYHNGTSWDAWITDTGGAGAVSSVFTRTGAVVAQTSDYDASQIDNDSGVTGATVAAALDWLAANAGATTFAALTDTNLVALANGQTLKYNSTGGNWENVDATTIDTSGVSQGQQYNIQVDTVTPFTGSLVLDTGGGATTLDDLTDVDTTGKLDGDVFGYSSGSGLWGPVTLGGAGLTVGGTPVVGYIPKATTGTGDGSPTWQPDQTAPGTVQDVGKRYVWSGGDNSNGLSWATAFTSFDAAWADINEGVIEVGDGIYGSNGVVMDNKKLLIVGQGADSSGARTKIQLNDVAQHLFRETSGTANDFMVWKDIELGGSTSFGQGNDYDLIHVINGGFGMGLFNVHFSHAPRYAIYSTGTLIDFYGYNISGTHCARAFFRFNVNSSLSNVGFWGLQLDDCGRYPVQIVYAATSTGAPASGLVLDSVNAEGRWNMVALSQVGGSGGDTFTITYGGQTTSALAWNATAAQVRTAFRALPNVSNCQVWGTGTAADPWILLMKYHLAWATSATVANGGSGYSVGNQLTLVGGTGTTASVFNVDAVSGGVVTAVSLVTPGVYSAPPTPNPVATTGGAGTGCTLTVTWVNASTAFDVAPTTTDTGALTTTVSRYTCNDALLYVDASSGAGGANYRFRIDGRNWSIQKGDLSGPNAETLIKEVGSGGALPIYLMRNVCHVSAGAAFVSNHTGRGNGAGLTIVNSLGGASQQGFYEWNSAGNAHAGEARILQGYGAPGMAAPPGSIYFNLAGGAGVTLYVKESGTDSTGWVAMKTAP